VGTSGWTWRRTKSERYAADPAYFAARQDEDVYEGCPIINKKGIGREMGDDSVNKKTGYRSKKYTDAEVRCERPVGDHLT